MNNTYRVGPIRFSRPDLALFSQASHDRNPLHLSDVYARQTPYGECVVFGILGGLASLAYIQARPGSYLSRVSFEFPAPLFVDIDYTLELSDTGAEQVLAKLYDGRRMVLKAQAVFCPGAMAALPVNTVSDSHRVEPACLEYSDLAPGFVATGTFSPLWDQLGAVMKQWNLTEESIGAYQVAALMWSSYLVGMELPGRDALFAGVSLDFKAQPGKAGPLSYEAKILVFDTRLDLLKVGARLLSGEHVAATAELRAFVRRPAAVRARNSTKVILPRTENMGGKVALVIGASRGLGAAITRTLAWQGCTVLANYMRCQAEAESLQRNLSSAPGKVVLSPGDARNLEWCQTLKREIASDYGRLDFLICNACPALLPLWLEPESVSRINDYVSKSLALVSAPLAAFVESLAKNSGRAIVISSHAVEAPPPEWPHYVAAKCAIEGITRTAAAEYRDVNFLIVRPPRLLTDLTNTPLGWQNALAPEDVAAQIARRLAEPGAGGQVEILEFSS